MTDAQRIFRKGLIMFWTIIQLAYYLLLSFIIWNFNILIWPPLLRAAMVIEVVLMTGFFIYGWHREKNNVDIQWLKDKGYK